MEATEKLHFLSSESKQYKINQSEYTIIETTFCVTKKG